MEALGAHGAGGGGSDPGEGCASLDWLSTGPVDPGAQPGSGCGSAEFGAGRR